MKSDVKNLRHSGVDCSHKNRDQHRQNDPRDQEGRIRCLHKHPHGLVVHDGANDPEGAAHVEGELVLVRVKCPVAVGCIAPKRCQKKQFGESVVAMAK